MRIIRACRSLGIDSMLAVSECDKASLPSQVADQSICIGPAPATKSYLRADSLIAAAIGMGADAIHPGYGFLAENAEFAEKCISEGLTFVGPAPDSIRVMGDKLAARKLAESVGVPILPGSKLLESREELMTAAEDVGYPIVIKAAAGGGGRGMRVVHESSQILGAFEMAANEAAAAFGDSRLYLERCINNARHVEIQILGDEYGNIIHLGARDCSVQRRHQKLIEEAPPAFVANTAIESMVESSIKLANTLKYRNAGTIEFIYDMDTDRHYFLEMNTRLQVEHGITEEVTGVDLVELQLKLADGSPLQIQQSEVELEGHAIECRILAEDPLNNFSPSPGKIEVWSPPDAPWFRLESHCYEGYVVPPFYDSLIAKAITYGADREDAIAKMESALSNFKVDGIATNIDWTLGLLTHPDFIEGRIDTKWIQEKGD